MSDPVTPGYDHTPLKQYFGIESPYDDGWGEDFDFIISRAQGKAMKREDMLLELKNIELKLGSPTPGEKRWHRIKHYLSLQDKLDGTLKEMAAHERGWRDMA